MANPSPGESLRIWESLSFQPSATLSTGSFEQHLGEGDFGGTELEDKHRRHLDILRQTSLLLAHKLKLQQQQQKHRLLVLREKAKQEVEESHRFLRGLLQLSSEWSAAIPCFGCSSTFHGSSLAVVEQCLRAEELRARHQALLLQLRRKALRERARAELAWLGHRRRQKSST
ncbi:centrosome-associated protein 350-like [Camarhynchus parvulus]|uniref:centrosome-associated protein 350-like n=1 Tax=Geospiza parvula TaxID=87175 RepID=UPI001237C365|nr:centrosome-associated protein 350-like [Camarhynchus parvulus]